jgi:hypothetical protein
MQKKSSWQSGLFNLRVVIALLLCAFGASLGWLSFAASPSGGTITPSGPTLTWNGTGTGIPPTGGGESACTEAVNCDSYNLTISGTPSDWTGKQVHVQINWASPSSDYDMYVHKGSLSGPVVASSGAGGTTQEQVDLNPASTSIGTGTFVVHVVYFAATQADQYHGAASVIAAGLPPLPAPTPATGSAPGYENFTPAEAGPDTLGRSSGEPSIGIGLGIAGHPEGRALFQSDVQTLRVTFNGCAKSLWENKPPITSQVDFDPILFTDRVTGRTIVHLLSFAANTLVGESSFTDTAFPGNDGDVWTPSQGTGIGSGIDHQTVGGGPYHAPLSTLPPNPAYPRAVYYCSQALVEASCARSDNGGLTYGASTPLYTDQCGGLHGHVKVAPDGTVYVPNKGCGSEQGVVVSEDNGLTWNIRKVPGSVPAGSDPSVGVGRGDQTGGKGRVYFGYADGDTKAAIAMSNDQGRSWTRPLDVGAAFGINNVVFPAVVAGDDNRAAFAFLGTPTAGGLQGPKFDGVWHLYIATTYDGGATWKTVDATPTDPVQRGCIWLAGGANVCRNLLDFMDVQIDQQGRVLVAYADGCAGGECAQAAAGAVGNSYTALAAIARQSGGRRLLAAFDPPTGATAPGKPFVTAERNGSIVHLGWSEADNGGSAITQYRILRGMAPGTETFLAAVGGNQTRYNDTTATNTAVTYYYKVTATNAVGTSCGDNEVSARYVGNSDTGFTLAADPSGDQKAAPGNADLDVQSLTVAEPGTGANAGKLVFKLKVADLSISPPNRMWRVVWNSPASPFGQYYLGMTKDANGAVSFEYGTVESVTVGLVLGVPTTHKVGTPDAASFTPGGLITFVMSKDKVGNPRKGDLLGAFSARTYSNVADKIRSTDAIDTTANATANDYSANAATYALVGSGPEVNSVLSRKRHGTAGTFDVNLPRAGAVGIECRTGGTNGTHQIVFTFADPVIFVSASVTNGTGTVGSFSGNGTPVITLNLNGVTDIQTIQVTLNVSDGSHTISIPVSMGVLGGDVTSDRVVNSKDQNYINSKSGQIPTAATFRADVTVDGLINGNDASFVGNRNGHKLP